MKQNQITIRSNAAEYLTYVASSGNAGEGVEIRYEDENIWLTQKTLAQLYDVEVNTINYHIKKIFEDSELEESSTIRNFRIVQIEGSRQIERTDAHYSLQMIIAVGFKVNSARAVQFRKWVNENASEYTIKGWVMDDERLKNGTFLSDKYFDEQLARIREIRASERKFYQKVTDIYSTAFDYDRNSETTKNFFKTVYTDVSVAKNYLSESELIFLNRLVTMYLDYAELQAENKISMSMEDWAKRLDSFIEFNGREILTGAGKISAEEAKLHAETEFEKLRIIQDKNFVSDYDRFMLELESKIEG